MPELRRIGLTVIAPRPDRKKLIIKSLHEGPAFSDTLMLHACFQVLVNYVHSVGEANLRDPLNQDRDASLKEIRSLYDYWVNERPLLVGKEELAHEYEDRLEAAAIEETRRSTDDQYLNRLVALRQYMTPV